jgi:hypothetical protein
MRGNLVGSIKALRRKLRGVAAVVEDPGATEYEKANAAALKARLEQRLKDAGAPQGTWTDNVFRLGRWAGKLTRPLPPGAARGDWTDEAFRLGRALRRSYKSWSSK